MEKPTNLDDLGGTLFQQTPISLSVVNVKNPLLICHLRPVLIFCCSNQRSLVGACEEKTMVWLT